MLVGIVEVCDSCIDVAGPPGAQIVCYGGEFVGVAGDEEEACPLGGPYPTGCFGNT
jgi:hypothetical protein